MTEFKELLTGCVNETIVPFFVEFSNTERITKAIEDVDFADLIHSPLRGDYPSNYFKAIYLFDLYGFCFSDSFFSKASLENGNLKFIFTDQTDDGLTLTSEFN